MGLPAPGGVARSGRVDGPLTGRLEAAKGAWPVLGAWTLSHAPRGGGKEDPRAPEPDTASRGSSGAARAAAAGVAPRDLTPSSCLRSK